MQTALQPTNNHMEHLESRVTRRPRCLVFMSTNSTQLMCGLARLKTSCRFQVQNEMQVYPTNIIVMSCLPFNSGKAGYEAGHQRVSSQTGQTIQSSTEGCNGSWEVCHCLINKCTACSGERLMRKSVQTLEHTQAHTLANARLSHGRGPGSDNVKPGKLTMRPISFIRWNYFLIHCLSSITHPILFVRSDTFACSLKGTCFKVCRGALW